MKKLLSLAIAALLTFSCALTAFAAADNSATPDEVKTPVELRIVEFPTKSFYSVYDVTLPPVPTMMMFSTSLDYYYAIADEMVAYYFSPKLNLSGAKFEVVYSDGSTEAVDTADCTAEVANPFNYGDVMRTALEQAGSLSDDATEDEQWIWYYAYWESLDEQMNREFTVNVEYKTLSASYGISTNAALVLLMDEPDIHDNADEDDPFAPTGKELYEVVSITPGKLYYTKADIDSSYKYDGKTYYCFTPDIKGTKVTIKDTKSGKLYTTVLDGTELVDVYSSTVANLDKPNQIVSASFVGNVEDCFGITTPEGYNRNVEFDFDVYFNYQSTNDTATKDTVISKNDNGAVQTGSPITTALFLTAAIIAGGALFISYRKKS